jgi:hypothetical protein
MQGTGTEILAPAPRADSQGRLKVLKEGVVNAPTQNVLRLRVVSGADSFDSRRVFWYMITPGSRAALARPSLDRGSDSG